MNISSLDKDGFKALSFSDVSDIVIEDARVDKPTRIRILTGDSYNLINDSGTVLLDNDYYGDPLKEIHLDLREIVRDHTWIPVPGLFF